MKKLFLFLALIVFLGMNINIDAQTSAITLIMCERYDETLGPIGAGMVFTTGYLTVVAMSTEPMYYDAVFIQYDILGSNGKYRFYKKFPFTFPNGYKTVYFSRVGDNDMEFNDAGFYNVFLLDKYSNVIASTTVTIVNR